MRIIVRADSGFARNPKVASMLAETFEQLHERIDQDELRIPARQFVEFGYRTQNSWSPFRRMVDKAEVLDKGDNPRFVVTNLPARGFLGACTSSWPVPTPGAKTSAGLMPTCWPLDTRRTHLRPTARVSLEPAMITGPQSRALVAPR